MSLTLKLYPKSRQRVEEDLEESEGEEDDDMVYFLNTEIRSQINQPRCQQCPQLNSLETTFQCAEQQNHLMCQCCYELMPEREDFKQKCEICCNIFCSLYWKCKNPACTSCLLFLPGKPNTYKISKSHKICLIIFLKSWK